MNVIYNRILLTCRLLYLPTIKSESYDILFIYFYSGGPRFQGFRGYPTDKQPQRIMKCKSSFIIILKAKTNTCTMSYLQKLTPTNFNEFTVFVDTRIP